jgi:predicted outer membrane repeat protein
VACRTRDSGAILIGAGEPSTSSYDRQRESFSSYGSRVDVQGWGSGVVTTGYGDLYGYDEWLDDQYLYTATFGGTSSASPMVAAAAAIVQAIAIQENGAPLSPWQVRDLLVATGSPQLGNAAERIGPRPNLRQAIAELPQSAATLTVTTGGSGNDGVCGVTNCTLSEAIDAANQDGIDTIVELAAGETYTLDAVDNTDPTYGANGLPSITSAIAIHANGATVERSSAGATPEFRLFQVASGGSLTLFQATLHNRKLTGQPGGAVLNLGSTIIDSCTLTGNSAAEGGALANQGPYNLVFNSTLTGNSASGSGGAIQSSGALSVMGSTLAGNSAPTGESLATSGTTAVKNTILLKGTGGANCSGTLETGGVSNLADDTSCGASATDKTAAQINLGSLASNGGRTQTMALLSPSVAIDGGNATTCKVLKSKNADQRSYDRFADGNGDGIKECDIGAYEYNSTPLVPGAPAPDAAAPATRILLTPASPDGSNGWYRGPVIVKPEARDTGSGVSEVLSAAFQIDATPPALTCPAAGPFFLHSGDQPVGPAGVDASVSGLDKAASTLSSVVPTEAVGPKALTFTAQDLAGNQASLDCTYHVIYDFGGYYPPVEPAPALNPAGAGSAVPLKFSLAGDQGLDILAEGLPASQPVACDTLEPDGPLEATYPLSV